MLRRLSILVFILLATGTALHAGDSANGGQIAFMSFRGDNYEIYLMNADGSNAVNLTNNAANDGCPVWSPDGSRIAFESWRDGSSELYVMDADGANIVRLTDDEYVHGAVVWSPDGTRIAYNAGIPSDSPFIDFSPLLTPNATPIADAPTSTPVSGFPTSDLYIVNADGANLVRLTENEFAAPLEWLPDGERLIFNTNGILYSIEADGANRTLISETIGYRLPDLSPDGSQFVFEYYIDGHDDIFVMNVDGSGFVNLTNDNFSDEEPVWSPDGTRIAFNSFREGTWGIYVMNADGLELTPVLVNAERGLSYWQRVQWSPDGTRLLYTADLEDSYEITVVSVADSQVTNLIQPGEVDRCPAWRP